MQFETLWIRLPVTWDRHPWLRQLPRETRYLWLDLVRHIRTVNPTGWSIEFFSAEFLADDLRCPELSVQVKALLDAAVESEWVKIDGQKLEIVECEQFMSPDTIRKRNERKLAPETTPVEPKKVDNVARTVPTCPVVSGQSGLSRKEESREEEKRTAKKSKEQKTKTVFSLEDQWSLITSSITIDDVDSLYEAWSNFAEHRKQLKASSFTEVGLKAILSKISSSAKEHLANEGRLLHLAVQTSLERGWKSIVTDKLDEYAKSLPKRKLSNDEANAWCDEIKVRL